MANDGRLTAQGRRPTTSAASRRLRHGAVVLSILLLPLLLPSPAAAASLPYAPVLAHCYDLILDAKFDESEAAIGRACGPAPVQACELMRATALWWRIQLDPFNRSRDAQFESTIDAVIAALEQWTAREPKHADAWFFLGGAYGLRVQFRVLRGERLAAARDGKRIKDALERSLALDPTLEDAYFGIGLYHYYAAIAPAALRILRWMLFLPGGDRAEGLGEMLRARNRGQILRGEADFQLQTIYLWYEHKVGEALNLLEGLHATYPYNPLFLQSIADVQDVYRHDHPASLEAWRALFDLARERRVALPEMSEVRARMGMAAQLDALFETDAAIEQLRAVVAGKPAAPYGAAALAEYRLGAAYDRMGQRNQAVAAYRAALAAAPPDDPDDVATLARNGLDRRPDPNGAEAYRLSIEGLRRLQQHDLAQASDDLTRSAALNPADPVTKYRQALLLLAYGRDRDALAAFERLAAARPVPPPTVLAPSCLDAARLLEKAGQRDRAIAMYRRVLRVQGAESATRRAATDALDRLRVPPSSR